MRGEREIQVAGAAWSPEHLLPDRAWTCRLLGAGAGAVPEAGPQGPGDEAADCSPDIRAREVSPAAGQLRPKPLRAHSRTRTRS